MFLVPSVISIVVASVNLLMSLLFPVNCYLDSRSLPFVPPTLISTLLRREQREGEWEQNEQQCGLKSLSGRNNWGVTFLCYDLTLMGSEHHATAFG